MQNLSCSIYKTIFKNKIAPSLMTLFLPCIFNNRKVVLCRLPINVSLKLFCEFHHRSVTGIMSEAPGQLKAFMCKSEEEKPRRDLLIN